MSFRKRLPTYRSCSIFDELSTNFPGKANLYWVTVPTDAKHRVSSDYSDKMVVFARVHLAAYSWDQIEKGLGALSFEARHELSAIVQQTLHSDGDRSEEEIATEGRKIILESLTGLEQKRMQR